MGLTTYIGDITELPCECIVNAANKTLLGGGGVDGAIHRKAGKGLLEECRKLGGCETGQAKITKGYNTKAKYIIHTVGPIYKEYEDSTEAELDLISCYMNSLRLAMENNIHQIAFPAISTGIYGFPFEEATEIAVRAIKSWLKVHSDYAMAVILVFTPDKKEIAENTVRRIGDE